MCGIELVREIRHRRPGTAAVLVSGLHGQDELVRNDADVDDIALLAKPFRRPEESRARPHCRKLSDCSPLLRRHRYHDLPRRSVAGRDRPASSAGDGAGPARYPFGRDRARSEGSANARSDGALSRRPGPLLTEADVEPALTGRASSPRTTCHSSGTPCELAARGRVPRAGDRSWVIPPTTVACRLPRPSGRPQIFYGRGVLPRLRRV